jgi:hypothetical protein
MLWMSPRAVLNLALVSTLRLGARRQETFGSSLAGDTKKKQLPECCYRPGTARSSLVPLSHGRQLFPRSRIQSAAAFRKLQSFRQRPGIEWLISADYADFGQESGYTEELKRRGLFPTYLEVGHVRMVCF